MPANNMPAAELSMKKPGDKMFGGGRASISEAPVYTPPTEGHGSADALASGGDAVIEA